MASFLDRIPGRVARRGFLAAGVLAALMVFFVLAGILLPGRFEVRRTAEIAAPPELVFPLLNDLSAWDRWTPWGEIDSRLEGPATGMGARRVWDDPQMGEGSLTIVASSPPASLRYLVEVEGGAIRFEGNFEVAPTAGGSRVTWTETADLGWNPLLGWTAGNMEESQGEQLEKSLERLREQAERPPPGPR